MYRLLRVYRQAFSGLSREVWLLCAAMFINRSGTMVLPFLTLYLTQQLDFTLAQAGWVLSSFGVGSLAGNWIGGRLTDRYTYYDVQIGSLLLSGAMFLVLMQLESLYAWCAGFFLTSMMGDALRPANMAAIAIYSAPKNLTRAIALQRLAFNLGFAAGPVAAGWLAHTYGYRALFWADAITCISAALFLRIALPRRIEGPDAQTRARTKLEGSVFRNRRFLAFVLCQFLLFVAFMQFFSTLPVYLGTRLAMNEGQIGHLLALNGLIIVVIEMPLIPWLETRFRALQLIRLGNLIIAGSLLFLVVAEVWVGFVWLYLIGITLGEIVNFPFGSTHAMSFTQVHNRGRYMGAYGLAVSGGFIFAPFVGTHLAEWLGWSGLWLSMATLTLVAAAGITWVDRRRPAEISPGLI
jgi:predicted MFS family arabinose efflux permease